MAGRGIGHATLGRPVKGGAGERGVSKEEEGCIRMKSMNMKLKINTLQLTPHILAKGQKGISQWTPHEVYKRAKVKSEVGV